MFTRSHSEAIAVADIGSSGASVAIIETEKGKPSHVLAAARASLPPESRTPEAAIQGVIAKLSEAGEKALKEYASRAGAVPIASSYAIIRAPWSHSKSVHAMRVFDEETNIDSGMIRELASGALTHDKEYAPENILEATVMRVEANEYPTSKPEGKPAQTLGVAMLLSDCAPTIRAGVSEAMTRLFPGAAPSMRSGVRALLAVLRESAALPKDCLVVNMTAETTALITVRKGIVGEQALVDVGLNTILNRVAQGRLPEEALGLMRLLTRDQCEDDACIAIKDAIARAEPELVRAFGEGMGKLALRQRLPNALILAAHEDIKPWLSQFFSRIDFTQFTTTTRPFIPRPMTHEEMTMRVVPEAGIVIDPGLAMAAALVNIESAA